MKRFGFLCWQRLCNHCGNHFCSKCCSNKVPKYLFGVTGWYENSSAALSTPAENDIAWLLCLQSGFFCSAFCTDGDRHGVRILLLVPDGWKRQVKMPFSMWISVILDFLRMRRSSDSRVCWKKAVSTTNQQEKQLGFLCGHYILQGTCHKKGNNCFCGLTRWSNMQLGEIAVWSVFPRPVSQERQPSFTILVVVSMGIQQPVLIRCWKYLSVTGSWRKNKF